jgi:serine protease inhibitor/Tol biopolymer transport system component
MRNNKSIKFLIIMTMTLTGCSQSPNTIPASSNKPLPIPTNSSIQNDPLKSPAPSQPPNIPRINIKPAESQYFNSRNNPNWSPDGKKIVFTRGYKVFVADPEGKINILLADLKKDIPNIQLDTQISPVWSPSGNKISFVVHQSGIWESILYIVNSDGTNTYQNKELHYNGKTAWFPDGKRLLVSAKEGLAIINLDTSNFEYLKNDSGDNIQIGYFYTFEVSPDGNMFYLNDVFNLLIYDFQTNKLTPIKNLGDKIDIQYLSWAPDSKSLVFQRLENADHTSGIFKVNPDGSRLTMLSQKGENVSDPKWSPDGTKIAYVLSEYPTSNKVGLKVVYSDGTLNKIFDLPIEYFHNINWSPDSSRIAFNNGVSSFQVEIKNNLLTKIVDGIYFMKWSPDSKSIFYADKTNESFVTDLSGKNTINVFIKPVNPLVTQFNIKSPEQSEIDELNKSTIVAGNSKFALKIFSELGNTEGQQNLFISPLSMSLALSMAYNGANNNTKEQMMKTLEYNGISLENVNKYNNTLLRLLLTDQDITLSIANGIFSKKGANFKQDFLNINRENYFSEISELDFSSPEAVDTINTWVSDRTNDKIPKIIDKINDGELIFLINAIYFKGTWTNIFEKSLTKDQDFKLVDGTVKTIPMMNQLGLYKHFKDENVEFVRLPYGNSQRTGMYFFIPGEGKNLEQLKQNLSYENLDKWLSSMDRGRGNIKIPKFRLEYGADLIAPLEKLGMSDAFNSSADFTKMTDISGFLLTRALHKTFVEVNEEGTEAAAATIIGGGVTSVPDPPFNFTVDRPFITAIVDERTKTILFMGSIYDPQ